MSCYQRAARPPTPIKLYPKSFGCFFHLLFRFSFKKHKRGKPVLHICDTRKERIYKADSLRLEVQALTDFLCSNKIEVLNVAGPRELKEPGVYEWALNMMRLFRNRAVIRARSIWGICSANWRVGGRGREEWGTSNSTS